MFRFVCTAIFFICITVLAGCNETLDLTKNYGLNWPDCEVHQCQMRPEHFSVGGEIVYCLEYAEISQGQFPNHGGHRLNGEKENTPRDRDVIDFVCYKCNYTYEQYWKTTKKVILSKAKNLYMRQTTDPSSRQVGIQDDIATLSQIVHRHSSIDDPYSSHALANAAKLRS